MDNTGQGGANAQSVKSYRCPNCGGSVQFDIKTRSFLCTSCKSVYHVQTKGAVEEYSFDSYAMRERAGSTLTGIAQIKCDSCGGELFFDAHETAKRCPMCGSSSVRPAVAQSGIAPEGIVPFRVDQYDAQQRFRGWIQKRWLAPNLLKRAYAEGVLQGLYVPFWTFDAETRGDYSGQGGKMRTRRDREGNTHTETIWFPVSGSVYRNFDDVLICASRNHSGTIVQQLQPFNTTSDISPFAMEYLSGYVAERYSIDGEAGFSMARDFMEGQLRGDAHADIMRHGYQQAMVQSLHASYRNVTYKSVLLPVYTAQYSYRDKLYNYAINGQTGRVHGKYPKSPFKIALLVAAILALLIGLYALYNETEGSYSGDGGYYYYDDSYYYQSETDGLYTLQEAPPEFL